MKVEEATAKALQKEALDLKRGKLPAAGETWDIVLIFPFGPPAPSGPLRVSTSTATDDTGSATARETSAWHALAKRRLGMSCMLDCCISFCLFL